MSEFIPDPKKDMAWMRWAIRQVASNLGRFSAEHRGYVMPSDIVREFQDQFPWLLDSESPALPAKPGVGCGKRMGTKACGYDGYTCGCTFKPCPNMEPCADHPRTFTPEADKTEMKR